MCHLWEEINIPVKVERKKKIILPQVKNTLLLAAAEGTSIDQAAATGAKMDGDTVRYHLNKMNLKEVREKVNEALREQVLRLKKKGKITKKCSLAIDSTDYVYYGMEANPNLSNEEIRLILQDQAEDHDGSGGFDGYYGYGFCNARLSVNEAIWYGEDTDNDGVINGLEKYYYNTDPSDPDSDNDNLKDGWEVTHIDPRTGEHFNPLDGSDGWHDHDGDGLATNYEVTFWGTNWLVPDTDGDGWSDGQECVIYGTEPNNAGDTPWLDHDGDGLTTYEEVEGVFDLNGDGDYLDTIDGKSETDWYITNPDIADTDNDGWDDYEEQHPCFIFLTASDPTDQTSVPSRIFR